MLDSFSDVMGDNHRERFADESGEAELEALNQEILNSLPEDTTSEISDETAALEELSEDIFNSLPEDTIAEIFDETAVLEELGEDIFSSLPEDTIAEISDETTVLEELGEDIFNSLPEDTIAEISDETAVLEELSGDIFSSLPENTIAEISDETAAPEELSGEVFSSLPEENTAEISDKSAALPAENSKNKRFPWLHSPFIFLPPLFIIFVCFVALLLLGRNEFANLNEQFSSIVQAIFQSGNRVDQRLQEIQITLSQEIPDQEISNTEAFDTEKEASKLQQAMDEKLDALQNSMATIHQQLLIQENIEEPLVKDSLVEKPLVKDALVEKPLVKDALLEKPLVKDSLVEKPLVKDSLLEKPLVKDSLVEKPLVKDSLMDIAKQDAEEQKSSVDRESAPEEKQIIEHKKAAKKKNIIKDKKELTSETDTQPSCFKIYQAHDSDTLWEIAATLYGAGRWYPVLLFHNPDIYIYNISGADRIRYLCDTSLVPAIYKQQVLLKKTGKSTVLLWRYTVQHGDTIADLQNRYCPRDIQVEHCMNMKSLPEPGNEILIRLD